VPANRLIRVPKKRQRFHIVRECREIEALIDILPGDDEVHKFISGGGFSSVGFVRFVALRTHVRTLTVTTLRVGAQQLAVLDVLRQQGRLGHARFVIGSVMRHNTHGGKTYRYWERFVEVCEKNGWEYVVQSNHSKLLLFDTDAGKYVLETSSNLNENPSVEQFSFERSYELHDFYAGAVAELFGGALSE